MKIQIIDTDKNLMAAVDCNNGGDSFCMVMNFIEKWKLSPYWEKILSSFKEGNDITLVCKFEIG